MHPPFALRSLGQLVLHGPGGLDCPLRRQERILLVFLARRSPVAVPRAELAALLWGEREEARARRSLRQAIFSLRRLLGDALEITAHTVRLREGTVALDLNILTEAMREDRVLEALGVWEGEFLGTVDGSLGEAAREWVDGERAAARRLLSTAIDALAASTNEEADRGEFLRYARRWVERYPWDENGYVRLIEGLRGASHLAEAAAWHARAVESLSAAGDAPSPRLRALGSELTQAAPRRSGVASAAAPGSIPMAAVDAPATAAPLARADRQDAIRRWIFRRKALAAGALIAVGLALGIAILGSASRQPALARVASPPVAAAKAPAAAHALYEQGLRVLRHDRDPRSAYKLFKASLAADSTMAMAALQMGYAASVLPELVDSADAYIERAAALAARSANPADRLVRALAALYFNDPVTALIADSLVRLNADDVEAVLLAGGILQWVGRFEEAATQFQRVLAMAGSSASAAHACRVCGAYAALSTHYQMLDSADAALRAARAWASVEPGHAGPLLQVQTIADAFGLHHEGEDVRRKLGELRPRVTLPPLEEARRLLRTGDLAKARVILAPALASADANERGDAEWFEIIRLRFAGRTADALVLAERFARDGAFQRISWAPLVAVLMDRREGHRAAAVLDTAMSRLRDPYPTRAARNQAWMLTLKATALADAGDTTRLAQLADSIEAVGQRSAYVRDRRLHHHVRGMLALHRGDLEGAERAFRASIVSPTLGFSRTSLELARILLATNRPVEAAQVLQAAISGPIDGMGLYVTRPALLELLEEARQRPVHRMTDLALSASQ